MRSRYTYLDTKGRPVLEFKQYNVLTNQDALFTVYLVVLIG